MTPEIQADVLNFVLIRTHTTCLAGVGLFSRFRVADHGVHQPDNLAIVVDAVPKPTPGCHLVLPLLQRLTIYVAGTEVAP